jgi:hypothetical protein
MGHLQKKIAAFVFGVLMMAGSAASVSAHPIRTPEGNMPMVHLAVVESTPGMMSTMGEIAVRTVGPQSASEAGTYALYGGIDASNPDVMRLLEIMKAMKRTESTRPVRHFRHIAQNGSRFSRV